MKKLGVPPENLDPLRYAGPRINVVPVAGANRRPSIYDRDYPLFTLWRTESPTIDGSNEGEIWYLSKFSSGNAIWLQLFTGISSLVTFLTDAGAPAVMPDAIFVVDIIGGTGISTAGQGPGNVITINAKGSVPLLFTEDAGTATPALNNLNIVGGAGISTSGAGSTVTISLTGGGIAIDSIDVDAHTAPGTDPVTPDAGGQIKVTGGQTAPGTISNIIQTNSLSANTYTIQVQQTSVAAAKDVTLNGVAHFNSSEFTNDQGFISLLGGGLAIDEIKVDAHTAPGTDPVLPTGAGRITVTGGQLGPGTISNIIQANSLSANTYTIQIQQTSVAAAKNTALNGVSHFNSAQFTNDEGFVSLVGGGASIEKVNVQTGTTPIVPSSGAITINGTSVAAGTNPVRTDGTGANTLAVEVQTSQAIASTDATKIGLSNYLSTQFSVDANGFVQILPAAIPFGVSNIGIAYAAGTFTVQGYNGTALSATNPGVVWLQNKATPGRLTRYLITANQTFTDGAAGVFATMRWGLNAGINYSSDLPFYLYAVGDDTESTISLMISRVPQATVSPAAASIGKIGALVNVGQGDFFSLANVTVANYDGNPCINLGSFRMQFVGATNSWTVQALNNTDGIGQFQENVYFAIPFGVLGASANSPILPNGGTAPTFTTGGTSFKISKIGSLFVTLFVTGDGGTAGAGAVATLIPLPYTTGSGANFGITRLEINGTNNYFSFEITGGSNLIEFKNVTSPCAAITNDQFVPGSRQFSGSCNFGINLS